MLPSHLRYAPSIWLDDIAPETCFVLLIAYLDHLYNQFEIQKLLSSYNPSDNGALLDVSTELLKAVLDLIKLRNDSARVQKDSVHVVGTLLPSVHFVRQLTKQRYYFLDCPVPEF